jgi:hypothetical protein
MSSDPPKLIDVLEREFLPQFGTQTAYQYRHVVKQLARALGYQPTARDLRLHVIEWLENRLTILGYSDKHVQCMVQRIHAVARWYALHRMEGRVSV